MKIQKLESSYSKLNLNLLNNLNQENHSSYMNSNNLFKKNNSFEEDYLMRKMMDTNDLEQNFNTLSKNNEIFININSKKNARDFKIIEDEEKSNTSSLGEHCVFNSEFFKENKIEDYEKKLFSKKKTGKNKSTIHKNEFKLFSKQNKQIKKKESLFKSKIKEKKKKNFKRSSTRGDTLKNKLKVL